MQTTAAAITESDRIRRDPADMSCREVRDVGGFLQDGYRHIRYAGYMETESAIAVLSALAQPTRLDVFRLLVRHEPVGLAAGEIARRLDVPQNTMSAHFGILARAGLVHAERHSRSIIYRADLNGLRALTLFLVKDCCAGNAELCKPLVAALAPCC